MKFSFFIDCGQTFYRRVQKVEEVLGLKPARTIVQKGQGRQQGTATIEMPRVLSLTEQDILKGIINGQN